MAACKSLQHIFENPLPEKPTLLESLSLGQIKPIKSIDQNSFAEIFGELHFKESPESSPDSSSSSFSSFSSSSSTDFNLVPQKDILGISETRKQISCLKSRESLQLCTEGLGSESSDDVEEVKNGMNENWETQREKVSVKKEIPLGNSNGEYFRRPKVSGVEYPPPISCIGRNGKPWVCFKSFRNNGRFVLTEVRIPTLEFLHAHRENGRLKLNFVQPDDDEGKEEEYDDDDDDDDDDGEEQDDEEEGEECGACETDQVNEEKEIDV